MAEEPSGAGRDDDLQEMLRRMLNGEGVDPAALAAAGLPADPGQLAALMAQLQSAMGSGDGTIDWKAGTEQAVQQSRAESVEPTPADRAHGEQAFTVADLWVDEATAMSTAGGTPRAISRAEWVRTTMPVWISFAEPVATGIADALTGAMEQQAPPELRAMLPAGVIRSVGGTLFSLQLGQVVVALSREAVSGGDVGVPLLDEGRAVILPQNLESFGAGPDVDQEQLRLGIAVREVAHARLFRHARWLRLQVVSAVRDYASGFRIDVEGTMERVGDIDPSDAEQLQSLMSSGALIPPRTPEQEQALARLETTLALIEGWVDVVAEDASTRLPKAGAIAETVRRRRASGGPGENAFATLVGLELRPRRLREAAAMWRAVTDAVGVADRDRLWSHPDLLPSSAEIDDPTALITRLRTPATDLDEMDRALEDLLNDDDGDEHDGGDDPRPV